MLLLLFAVALFGAALTSPVNLATFGYATDFYQYQSVATFNCLRSAGYSVAFVRGYAPSGLFDSNSVQNIKNAYSAGVGTEVYMSPAPKSNKTAAQQFDELYNGLSANGISVKTIWFQVASPALWNNNTSTNKNFISSLIVKAGQRSVQSGIYTNKNDWNRITGNWTAVPSGTMLWYSSVNTTAANFNDYQPFGGFAQPSVKQYQQNTTVCGQLVNLDAYKTSAKAMSFQKETFLKQGLVVGGNFGF